MEVSDPNQAPHFVHRMVTKVLGLVGTPTADRKREAETRDVTSDRFPLSRAANQRVPLRCAEPSKQNDDELMACIKASQGDAMGLQFQSSCLLEIQARTIEFSSALYLAAETSPLEAL
jgi:hypothetical protein